MIQFTNNDYPNFHISVHNEDFIILVSLNITTDMKPFLSPNLVVKSKKHTVYLLQTKLPINGSNEQIILSKANKLINTAMINCREAKQKVLEAQISKIKKQSPRLTSNN